MKKLALIATALALVLRCAPVAAGNAKLHERVDAIFAPWDSTHSPGCALAVIRDGAIVYRRGYGMANLEHGVAITPATAFYVGSVSKQFVAASIALLAEEGKLHLDDDIRKYVPEIPAYDRPITLRQMIHHTSGLRDYLTLLSLAGRSFADSVTEEEVIDLLARQKKLNFGPGDEHLYSNSGYFLLAVIVKRVSGKSLREYAEEKIFKPLDMASSHFHDEPAQFVFHRAEGHIARDDGGWGLTRSRFALVGSGGLFTTVEDLSRWDGNFYENRLGKARPELIQTLLTRGRLNGGKELDYAFGLTIGKYRGLDTVRHGGALGGYRAHLIRFPKERFSVALACNLDDIDPGDLAERVADVYLQDKLEPKPPPAKAVSGRASPAPLDDYVGRYELQPGFVIGIREQKGRLVARISGKDLELLPLSRDELLVKATGDRLTFQRDDTGKVTGLVRYRGDQRDEAKRLPGTPSDRSLAEITGTYWSDELQVAYRLFMEGGDLFVRVGYNPKRLLHLLSEDVAYRPGLKMSFERDANGRIQGFVLDAGRVRGLWFVRR